VELFYCTDNNNFSSNTIHFSVTLFISTLLCLIYKDRIICMEILVKQIISRLKWALWRWFNFFHYFLWVMFSWRGRVKKRFDTDFISAIASFESYLATDRVEGWRRCTAFSDKCYWISKPSEPWHKNNISIIFVWFNKFKSPFRLITWNKKWKWNQNALLKLQNSTVRFLKSCERG